jgi:hypothetical protein
MRTIATILLLATVLLPAAYCAAPGKVSLDAQNMPIKDAITQLATQSQATIVLDPKAEGNITINLTDVEIGQALDVITKMNKLTWKKVSFALPEGDSAKLDQLKSAILALATIPVTGLIVDDPATKQSSVMARNLPSSPETSVVKLPEGYTWKTFYVVTPPIVAVAATGATSKNKLDELTAQQSRTMQALAAMTPEERKQYYVNEMMAQMNLTPEARQSLIRDRMDAMHNMDPQLRDQMRQDMGAAFGGRHGGPDGGGDRGNHGNRDAQSAEKPQKEKRDRGK